MYRSLFGPFGIQTFQGRPISTYITPPSDDHDRRQWAQLTARGILYRSTMYLTQPSNDPETIISTSGCLPTSKIPDTCNGPQRVWIRINEKSIRNSYDSYDLRFLAGQVPPRAIAMFIDRQEYKPKITIPTSVMVNLTSLAIIRAVNPETPEPLEVTFVHDSDDKIPLREFRLSGATVQGGLDKLLAKAHNLKFYGTNARANEAWAASLVPKPVHRHAPERKYPNSHALDYEDPWWPGISSLYRRRIYCGDFQAQPLPARVQMRWGSKFELDSAQLYMKKSLTDRALPAERAASRSKEALLARARKAALAKGAALAKKAALVKKTQPRELVEKVMFAEPGSGQETRAMQQLRDMGSLG